MRPGLVSISFRSLSWQDTLALAKEAGLEGIEWGGDVHVPHGDTALAREVGEATRAAGLAVAAYGSYYRLGEPAPDFADVLASAEALGAPVIRIWAGHKGSAECDEAEWTRLIEDARRVTAMAAAKGILVTFEYHGHTLTDTADTCARLLNVVPDAKSYWQPPVDMPADLCLQGLLRLKGKVVGVHTFSWHGTERDPLQAREADWKRFLAAAKGFDVPWALLEFVKGDEPAQLLRDAAVLKGWLAEV